MSDATPAPAEPPTAEQAQMPAPHEWNAAVMHSQANPDHILGPYEDLSDVVHMECSCGFDTADLTAAADSKETSRDQSA